ncbi:hypothetical protein GGTG_00667 [Gaeumannomyces tritici R3-111a-1]|uniref:Uncharacterized protein n=1 Tax=Gaeumannomyces tritici (strain R3-111a-1) TaxID=644352 RepID=J3NHD0_GAET3|nr:hypothetical protein GGTG_00667 [Gaeumannomyces tritici R3-111a-1]EJT80673.1 hypothetical protein GGTG_00667 [Gaeumannomyces tritici R3-111a-1]
MSSQAQPGPPSTGLSTGGIVGITIVLVVGVALVLAGLVWMRRRKQRGLAAAAGGLEAAKHQQQQLPLVDDSTGNLPELAGDGGGDRGPRELPAPAPPPSLDHRPLLPHQDSPQAPPGRGHGTPDRRRDAGDDVDRAARPRSGADASPPPRPPKEPLPPHSGNEEAAGSPVLVSGPVEMPAEDWPGPAEAIPLPEQKSMPRELSATGAQRSGSPLAAT